MSAAGGQLFCFGLGYSALALVRLLAAERWTVSGTCRGTEKAAGLRARGFAVELFERGRPLPAAAMEGATHVLVSVPPDPLGYLSTTGVYGDRDGGWVDETSALRPSGERGRRRVAAETGWLELGRRRGVPVHIFRLAAIYGPGRNPFTALRAGTARRIDKAGQVFSRIHVEDLARVLAASMARPHPGAVYNVCDDEPAAAEAVVAHAAALLGLPAPPLTPFAAAPLSPMARGFYDDNKRVGNALIKREFGAVLRFPDYRAGLAAILTEEAAGLPNQASGLPK